MFTSDGGITDARDMVFTLLEALYLAYGEQAAERTDLACAPGCFVCCTDQVALTTLEARYMLEGALSVPLPGRADPAARPANTVNALARMCLTKNEPPPEPDPPKPRGVCPWLENGLCSVYHYRPMACRTMASKSKCQKGGQALDDPWWVTVNTTFFQLVEHLDFRGKFGLMADVFGFVTKGSPSFLLDCEDLPGIPAMPGHEQRLQNLLTRVLGRQVSGRPLGWWMKENRTTL
ncbi:hypothetical protein [Dethiosulfatarculus sandiegensis]|uniref:Uncharacterized protein n=1 Tax=Dethiosulfatarculus sandiegensis TaxID=1429043 RepID=A0A0D2HWX3_9BACT|nr:hypothetical protein [Dethiosulfatarculus sandiegensis]KIX14868.1 hypothetical protein X474_06900 [Dethiosulfatarculus sandiegensis]